MSTNESVKPIKVVWICHLSNREIQSQLMLSPQLIYHEFQPWTANTLELFLNDTRINLFIVSPHHGLNSIYQTIRMGSVTYRYFRPYGRVLENMKANWFTKKLRAVINILFPMNEMFDYPINSYRINKIVQEIKPDIIHLQGAECPFYSSSILRLKKKYPVVVTVQGFISHTIDKKSRTIKHQIKVEEKILKGFSHFGVRTNQMSADVRLYNASAKQYWLNYRIKEIYPYPSQKIYDIVFFARICKDKGIEDLINALGLINCKRKDTSLLIIGLGNREYITLLENLARKKSVDIHITWTGFLATQDEVHQMVSKSRVSVLPTYHDIIPGTIIESMQLGLPVVSYKTGSIPELNEEQENVILVEKGDIAALADRIIRLLTDQQLYTSMSQRGLDCIGNKFGNQNIFKQHLDCYLDVIADFQKTSDVNRNS